MSQREAEKRLGAEVERFQSAIGELDISENVRRFFASNAISEALATVYPEYKDTMTEIYTNYWQATGEVEQIVEEKIASGYSQEEVMAWSTVVYEAVENDLNQAIETYTEQYIQQADEDETFWSRLATKVSKEKWQKLWKILQRVSWLT